MGNTSRGLIFIIVLLVIFAAVAVPQQTAPATVAPASPQAQPQPQLTTQGGTAAVLKVKTRLVVVDVVVVDHKGVPVTDLKAEDFTLREEGAEQKIRVFSFQQPSQSQGQPATLAAATLPPSRITNMPRFKTNSTLNVLLDGINVTSQNQKYAREQMLKFLEKLPAGQPIAVYALGSRLRMLQDFTTDPALLKAAVKKAKDNAMGVRTETSNAADLPPGLLEQMPDAMLQSILRFGQDQAINQMDERVSLTLAQLGALAGNLARYPGRKNLIWLSEAFPAYLVPSNPAVGGSSGIAATIQPLIKTYQTQIDHAADLLSNAQVAVYPVDATTLTNRDAYSSLSNSDSNGQYLGRSARGAGRVGLGSQQASEISRSTEAGIDAHSTMNSVADQTGGKAFYNTNNLEKAIRESMDDGSTYYTLGYYPENKAWDGRFRKIAVKVNRPGAKLHYRQGFFAVEPKDYIKQDPKILAVDLGTALDLNNPISTALPFQAVVVPPSAQNGNKVQINFGVDPHAISFELRDDGLQHAAIDCGVRVYTKTGESVRIQGNAFNAALTADQYQKVMQMIFPCNQTLDLSPGEYILRLAVRDNTNGLIGTANGSATVPALAAGQQSTPQEKKP
ncbi:MAG: VWA domain-containing protein [Acidobacteriia bacterium]|nr:VWA domain-containing protein [Terriglobia bacterium]